MAKAKNTFEFMARDAAARLDKLREQGGQLTFLPDEPGSVVDQVEGKAPGRPKGAKGKVSNQMRDWLAAKGYSMPEDQLAQMAGLAARGDAIMTAMEQAELVLAWAYDGAMKKKKGGGEVADTPSAAQRLAAFMQLYTIQLRAADALLPYGAPKATPDVHVNTTTNVIVPSAPAAPRPGDDARVIDHAAPAQNGARMAPPPLPEEMQQNQQVKNSENGNSDG